MSTANRAVNDQATSRGFTHLGLLYDGETDYLAATVGFVNAALSADEPVLVAVPATKLALIREGVGEQATRVTFADMQVAGRNPGWIIPGVLLAFANAHPGRRVSIIGEPIWPGRSAIEYPACAAHEALINAAFANRGARILCPYDVTGLDPRHVADAHRTHPVLTRRGTRWASTTYTDPVETAATFNEPLPSPPPDAAFLALRGREMLTQVRSFIAGQADHAGVAAEKATDLVVAGNEVATNTVEHTGGEGRITAWVEGGLFVCRIDDSGHITDPLTGRIPVAATERRGRGLLLVNQLCDLVRTHTGPAGTSVQLHMTI